MEGGDRSVEISLARTISSPREKADALADIFI
jgi:hypothetical protein